MRLGVASILGLLSAAACGAGQIQIGGANGLTTAYINQTAGAGQNACAAGAGNCLAGSASGFAERNYETVLFSGSTPAATPYATYNQNAGEQGTLGIFSMINDGTVGGNSKNYWDATSGTGASITVPIGIDNVTDVWTMLNNLSGAAGGTDTSVTFDFGTASNSATFNEVVVFTLTNSGGELAAASGQIGSAVICLTGSCGNDNGAVAGSSTATATLNSGPATNSTVTTGVLFGPSAYTSITGAYAGSTGDVVLNDQNFNLAQFVAASSSEYLVNIVVKEASGSTGLDGLSAVTVDTVSTPEPGTVLLFLTGLGALGLGRFRRK